jgi:hypothetical protein
MLFGSLRKQGNNNFIKQVTVGPSAVIEKLEEENPFNTKFYDDMSKYLRDKGYKVNICDPAAGDFPSVELWVTYGGYNAPEGTQQLVLQRFKRMFFTDRIKKALDRITEKKV